MLSLGWDDSFHITENFMGTIGYFLKKVVLENFLCSVAPVRKILYKKSCRLLQMFIDMVGILLLYQN